MKRFLIIICTLTCSLSNAQLLNGGMENYTVTINDTLPTNWSNEAVWSSLPGKTTDSYSGNFAFILNTWYMYSVGVLVNGKIPSDFMNNWIKAGTPINYKPSYLTGYYKYTNEVVGDSAVVKVALKKWNPAKNRADTVAFGIKKLPAISTYTNFIVTINDLMLSIQPDSVVVCFMSHDYAASPLNCLDPYCRYFYIDDISLEAPNNVKEISKDTGVSFYVHESKLVLKNKQELSFEAEVTSIEGKKLNTLRSKEKESVIDLGNLPPGVYFLSLSSSKGISSSKFSIVR